MSEIDPVLHMQRLNRDLLTVMQAAWIEWQRGRGGDAAMEWIEIVLDAMEAFPAKDGPHGADAEAYWDANRSTAEAPR